jgi:hypothetical protein
MSLLTVLLATGPVMAGERLRHSILGFSKDGRYFAFSRSGFHDGSGAPFCELVIADLERGGLAGKPTEHTEQDADNRRDPCRRATEKAKADLEKLGIVPGIAGSAAALVLPEPTNSATPALRVIPMTVADASGTRACELRLAQRDVWLCPSQSRETGPESCSSTHWQLAASCGGSEVVLHRFGQGKEFIDVDGIDVLEARVYQGRLAVVLAASTHGSEGPNVTPTVVGGPLPLKSGTRLALEALGFDSSGKLFGYVLHGTDARTGEAVADLHVRPVVGGAEALGATSRGTLPSSEVADALKKQQAAALSRLGVGDDHGAEQYRSGTATRTSFTIDGRGHQELALRITPTSDRTIEAVEVVLTGAGARRIVYEGKVGNSYSINSILLDRSRRSLAVILKYSRLDDAGETRDYVVALVQLD